MLLKGTYNTYFPKPNLRDKLHLDKMKSIVLIFHNHSVCNFSWNHDIIYVFTVDFPCK